jgi:putative Ca2+/H+ antiporter (TMEM165/GDT1 family)
MVELVDGLKEITAINLRYALAEVLVTGDRAGMARALCHLREAEAFLQILLMEMGDYSTEPTIAMAAQ